ncbi:YceI family protein [Curtobacterium flaccumfaciens]|nr:YceI family protein [Curtobacterium flaccumfaciens]
MHEVLNGSDVTVTGRTDSVTGSATVDGSSITKATITVQVADIATDSDQRDAYFRDSAMDTSAFPTATFELTEPIADAVPSGSGTTKVRAMGSLTLHGVTKAVTATLEVGLNGDGVDVSGRFRSRSPTTACRPRASASCRSTTPARSSSSSTRRPRADAGRPPLTDWRRGAGPPRASSPSPARVCTMRHRRRRTTPVLSQPRAHNCCVCDERLLRCRRTSHLSFRVGAAPHRAARAAPHRTAPRRTYPRASPSTTRSRTTPGSCSMSAAIVNGPPTEARRAAIPCTTAALAARCARSAGASDPPDASAAPCRVATSARRPRRGRPRRRRPRARASPTKPRAVPIRPASPRACRPP